MVAAIGGRIVCADLLDSGQTLEKLWSRPVSSYAMDALEENQPQRARARSAGTKAEDSGAVTEQEAAEFPTIPEDAEIEVFPSPGLGSNVRFSHRRLSGHALIYDGRTVHVAVFGPEEQSAAFGCAIRQPSRRRAL